MTWSQAPLPYAKCLPNARSKLPVVYKQMTMVHLMEIGVMQADDSYLNSSVTFGVDGTIIME